MVLVDGIPNEVAKTEGRHRFSNVTDNHDILVTFTIIDVGGIDDVVAGKLQIFPNPTTGQLRIQANGKTSDQVNEIEIFDVFGRLQKAESRRQKAEMVLDISHLPAGMYFVQIQTENGAVTRKVVKR
jgi:hypothetical protein